MPRQLIVLFTSAQFDEHGNAALNGRAIIRLEASCASAEYWIYATGQFGGVHAFGDNSAESEPIWMKSGALWVHCQGLALAHFEHDQHNSDRLRGRRVFCLVNNARFRRFPVGIISPNLNTTTSIGETVKNVWNKILKIYRKGSFFPKKCKNSSTNFNVLRLQAAIIPQWLQIARNLLPK